VVILRIRSRFFAGAQNDVWKFVIHDRCWIILNNVKDLLLRRVEPSCKNITNNKRTFRTRRSRLLRLPSLPIIEVELIRVTGDLHAIAVRVEKTDRAVAGHYQSLRSANDGYFPAPQNRMDLVDGIVRIDIDTEMMELGHPFSGDVFRPFRQSLQRDVMMLFAVTQKRHLGIRVPRRNFQPQNRAIKPLGSFEVGDIENNMTEGAFLDDHFSSNNRLTAACQDSKSRNGLPRLSFES